MQRLQTSLFEGLSEEALGGLERELEHRVIPVGAQLVAEGVAPRELYVIQSGFAEAFVIDDRGTQRLVNRLGPGSTVGEMSIITGQPASASVYARTELQVLVLSEARLHQVAERFPHIYQNLGAILAEKLARADRSRGLESLERVTVLRDHGAPKLLGYALACSVAWHTRAPTLLLVLTEDDPPPKLAAHAVAVLGTELSLHWRAASSSDVGARADLAVARPAGDFGGTALFHTLGILCQRYSHILLQVASDSPHRPIDLQCIRLLGDDAPEAAVHEDEPALAVRAWTSQNGARSRQRGSLFDVPPLCHTDRQAMAEGALPAHTAAGKALGCVARHLAHLTIGLALGAGSTMGYGHIGVVRVLDEVGIPVDYVAGTSIGSVVAAGVATGYRANDIAEILDQAGATLGHFALPKRSILSSSRLRALMQRFAGDRRIENLDVPLGIVAADIVSQQEVVFRRGLIWPALLASVSIPGIFPPQRVGPYTLVDGGVLNPVPSDVVADMGADIVIAVKLATRPVLPAVQAEAVEAVPGGPFLIQTITRSIEMMQSRITAHAATPATVMIELMFAHLEQPSLRNFSQGRRFIAVGEETARADLPRIAAVVPWLSHPVSA